METSPRLRVLLTVIAGLGLGASQAGAAKPAAKPLDPMAKAVIDSIRHRKPQSAPDLLEATLMAADADALADAVDFYRQFLDAVAKAGDQKKELLADLGDRFDPGALRRLERTLTPYEPDAATVLGAVQEFAGLRRRDPARLAAAAAALRDPARQVRLAAADQLARSGMAALPQLVDLLQTDDAPGHRARGIARGLIHDLGPDGRQALLAWLGSGDMAHWPGVIAGLSASGDEHAEYLLAPALAPDVPPAVRRAAADALAAHGLSLSPDAARAVLADRLDATLTQDALPSATSTADKTVGWFIWNAERAAPEWRMIPTRLARAQTAIHLARDLEALSPTDPEQVRLVLLARLETVTSIAGDRVNAPEGIPPDQLRAVLTGPAGFDVATVADVLDEAVQRGLTATATAAARAIRLAAVAAIAESDTASPRDPLPPAARRALVRAVTAPDAALSFEAARTLAVCAGDPPYAGSSLVVKTLLHAATSIGIDRAVVAHPDQAIVEELAVGLARQGYLPVRVRNGRDAVRVARESADTVLVVLAARLGSPSALETTQFLQRGSDRAAPPVLVVVDPLDDDPRGKFLTRLIQSFADVECVAIVDRMESFFGASRDAATGAEIPPRFLDALAAAGGPLAADATHRATLAAQRRERAREARATLAMLAARGWTIPEAALADRLARVHEKRHSPTEDLLVASRRMYNRPPDAERRILAGDLLDLLEAPRTQPEFDRADAP
jgi:hypothetical protein